MLLEKQRILYSYDKKNLGGDDYQVPLDMLLNSLVNEADLSLFGKIAVRYQISKHLKIRSQISDYHSNLSNIEISDPLFVIGLPRSGTTFLFNILSKDIRNRSPLFWEMMNPLPLVKVGSLRYLRRIFLTSASLLFQKIIMPGLSIIHPIKARDPEECLLINTISFTSIYYFYMANIPSYLNFLLDVDKTNTFKWHKKFLRVLEEQKKPEYWLLKDPSHLGGIETILKIYPNARFILLRRDPLETIPSICSLTAKVRKGFSSNNFNYDIGKQMLNFWSKLEERNRKQVKSLSTNQFIEIDYQDLLENPLDEIKTIYKRFDISYGDNLEKDIKTFIDSSTQKRKQANSHVYSLDEFGLTEEQVKGKLEQL